MRRTLLVCLLAITLSAAGLLAARHSAAPAAAAATHHGPLAGSTPHRVLAVVGASISDGIGAATPAQAWPHVLGRMLGLRAVVSADPGAGYLCPGAGDRGPMSRLLPALPLRRLHPALVIVQAGHNDIGTPAAALRPRVRQLVHTIRAEAPASRVAVLTVFPTGDRPRRAAWTTDATIISAARSADPHILVFDPLVGRWRFPRIADHLHPTSAGHRWIAVRIARQLGWHPVAARIIKR